MTVKPEDLTWEFTAHSAETLTEAHKLLDDFYRTHKFVKVEFKAGKQRTLTQNACLHLWLGWLAESLNNAGLDMRTVMKQDADLPWSTETCKQFLWKPIQRALINRESTTEAERKDYGYIEQVLSNHLQTKFPGIEIPAWPEKRLKAVEEQKQQEKAA